MHAWTVALHPKAEPELLALPADIRARFLHIAEMLEDFGPQHVGLPHVRPLEGKLWEMRMQSRDGISRAIYAATQGRLAAGAACVREEDPGHPAQGH